MNDYLVKSIDKTKNLRLLTITAKGVVSEAQKRHDLWSASAAVLGRTLVGSLLLAGAELTDKEELTVKDIICSIFTKELYTSNTIKKLFSRFNINYKVLEIEETIEV